MKPGSVAATVQAISLTSKPAAADEAVIACTLSAGSMQGRLDDWQSLLVHVTRREPIDGGVRCVFAASVPNAELIRLVVAEQDCCQFFQFAITVDTRGSPSRCGPPRTRSIVEAMFGDAA